MLCKSKEDHTFDYMSVYWVMAFPCLLSVNDKPTLSFEKEKFVNSQYFVKQNTLSSEIC